MITYNSKENQLIITIPASGIRDLVRYRKSILKLLGNVEINDCHPDTKETLQAAYKLLSYLMPDRVRSIPFKDKKRVKL